MKEKKRREKREKGKIIRRVEISREEAWRDGVRVTSIPTGDVFLGGSFSVVPMFFLTLYSRRQPIFSITSPLFLFL